MKRFLSAFELTVAEQRVVIALLLVLIIFFTVKTYRDPRPRELPPPTTQPSPL